MPLVVYRIAALAALAVLAMSPSLAFAQNDSRLDGGVARTSDHLAGAPLVTAIRVARPVSIDGRLDEAGWANVPLVPAMTQMDPVEGAPATERSDIRLLYDDEALYVGAFLYDPASLTTRLARRDANISDTDWFAIGLDTFHDHLTAHRFAVNPSGVKRDEVMTGNSTFGGDTNWDPVWEVATAVTDSGWAVEMRIPLSQLRFSRQPDQIWGVQIERRIGRKNEHTVLSYTPRIERGGIARYAHISGISQVDAASHRLEILPYGLMRADYRVIGRNSAVSFGDPFHDGSSFNGGIGADIKFRPTSNITFDATVNPDFGQVEVDPAVINLTAFETRFDERRPFFIEGADLFRFGGSDFGGRGGGGGGGGFGGGGGGPGGGMASPSSLLYSRRIGRRPQVSVPSAAVYSDVTDAATILGAAKMTGRLAGGWSVGLLEAVTAEERGHFVDAGSGTGSSVVEPLTNYVTGRIRRDLREGRSVFGAMATAVNRDLGAENLASQLRSAAYTGGLDFRHEWADRDWSAFGYVAGSTIRGRPEVMLASQRSSARYYQRPDADYVALDSAATSMEGYAARIDIGKRAGTRRGNIALSAISPGYEINDNGFLTQSDRISLDVNLNYDQTVPGRVFRRWNVRAGPDANWNFGGDRTGLSLGGGGNGQFVNFWNFGYNLTYRFETLDDRLTRGGVRALSPAQNSGFLFLSSDSRSKYTARVSLSGSEDAAGGWRWSTDLNFGIRASDRLELQFGPNFSRSYSAAQYVSTITDASAAATLGQRYIFAPIRQTTFSLETRLNVTFTPLLTLELYAQPFLSSGDFGDFSQLTRPRTFRFDTFGKDVGTVVRNGATYTIDPDGAAGSAPSFNVTDRDFNFRSLRGNAVLRWEWRAGSAIFLVWQQNRSETMLWAGSADEIAGNFAIERDARRLFGLRPDNVFMLKATWWFNP